MPIAKNPLGQRNAWIAVSERMPENNLKWDLLAYGHGKMEVVTGCHVNGGFWTHWMPLPDVPL